MLLKAGLNLYIETLALLYRVHKISDLILSTYLGIFKSASAVCKTKAKKLK